MLGFFEKKYPDVNPLIALRAICYFDDIDENMDPPNMFKLLSKHQIVTRIQDVTLHANKIFN
ncbi:MAG: hypothetical protein SH856_03320 [Flavobacteriales bacterium]|nr:hypothetical protein [Flavobacteriales bacterium]